MKKHWLIDGCIGIIVAMVVDIIIVVIMFTIGQKCTGDICYNIFLSSKIDPLIMSVLFWPAAIIKASLLRIVALAVYYFLIGIVVGLVYRKIFRRNGSVVR